MPPAIAYTLGLLTLPAIYLAARLVIWLRSDADTPPLAQWSGVKRRWSDADLMGGRRPDPTPADIVPIARWRA